MAPVKYTGKVFVLNPIMKANRMNRKAMGDQGEKTAAEYLEKKGYTIRDRNFRYGRYEVDLIARDGDTLVFVEVKATSSIEYGYPEEKVDITKQKKISLAAQAYIEQNKLDNMDCRFDVISMIQDSGENQIEHIEDAFWAD